MNKTIKILKNMLHSLNMRLNYSLACLFLAVLALIDYKCIKEIFDAHRGIRKKDKK